MYICINISFSRFVIRIIYAVYIKLVCYLYDVDTLDNIYAGLILQETWNLIIVYLHNNMQNSLNM